MLADVLLKILGETQEARGSYRPRPSSAGPERCIRSLTYHALGVPAKPFPGRAISVFDDGHWHAELMKDVIRKSAYRLHSEEFGVDCAVLDWIEGRPWYCQVCKKEYPPGVLHGHIDGIVTDLEGRDYLLELKSTNHFAYQRFWSGEYPLDYFTQTGLYIVGLRKLIEINKALMLVKNKNQSALMEFHLVYHDDDSLEVTEIVRSDGQRAAPGFVIKDVTRSAIAKFQQVEQFRRQRKLPPRPFEVGTEYPCTYCPWGEVCWEGYEAEWQELTTDNDFGMDFAAICKQERDLAAQESQVKKDREAVRDQLRNGLHALNARAGCAGPYLIDLSLKSRTTLDREAIPPDILKQCSMQTFTEELRVRPREKKKGGKR